MVVISQVTHTCTGATGFIGAHVVDELLRRGIKVRGTTRSLAKAQQMLRDRPEHAHNLEFQVLGDLATGGVFDEAVKGVDAIIHIASVSTAVLYLNRTVRKNTTIPSSR